MEFGQQIDALIAERHLLKHPFYQSWMRGELSQKTLQNYAVQYFPHVSAFPRYVSATHAQCENILDRQALLENLIDEERGPENHPELWLRFAEALGLSREQLQTSSVTEAAQNVVKVFLDSAKSSYEEGLGALYAYECQVPEIAESKISGLKQFYNVTDSRGLAFFDVHRKADVYHTQACREQLERLSPEQKERALKAADRASQALWDFLTSVHPESCHGAH